MPHAIQDNTRHPAEYRADRLEEERDRLNRRFCWALRRKDAAKAERLAHQLARVERELARPPEDLEGNGRRPDLRHRYGPSRAVAMGW